MKQVTEFSDRMRKSLGLPALAGVGAAKGALEVDGNPTDLYKVEASKMFGVPYDKVTETQRRLAKRASFYHIYP